MPETIAVDARRPPRSARSGPPARPISASRGVLDRFGQIEPKLFFAVRRLLVRRQAHRRSPTSSPSIVAGAADAPARSSSSPISARRDGDRGAAAARARRSTRSSRRTRRSRSRSRGCPSTTRSTSSSRRARPACRNASSTGAGGTLLQHLKEHRLHCDVRAGRPRLLLHHLRLDDVELAGLRPRARGDAAALRRLALPSRPPACCSTMREAERDDAVRHVGEVHRRLQEGRPRDRSTTPRPVVACALIASTGSPLAPESFDFVYDAIKTRRASRLDLRRHRHRLLLRARRSDRAGLARRDPGAGPRHGGRRLRRRRQAAARRQGRTGLHAGRSRRCRSASGTTPTGAKYRAAYFERFPGIWCHGDFAEWTEHGGIIIHGRSDATLNPGGVRIGTAEIYAQVEQIPEVIGGDRHRPGLGQRRARRAVRAPARRASTLDEALVAARSRPRSAPARARATCRRRSSQVADIPRTKSGKIVELAVRDVVHGRAGEEQARRSPTPRRSTCSGIFRSCGVVRLTPLRPHPQRRAHLAQRRDHRQRGDAAGLRIFRRHVLD